MSFDEFQLRIVRERPLKFIEMLETRSEDYQEIQEDTVSILLNFVTIKGKKSIVQSSLCNPS